MKIQNKINEITQQIHRIQQKMNQTNHVELVAATKYVDATVIRNLHTCGIKKIGENRVEALLEKKQTLQDLDLEWHLIGTLQTKKVKQVINEVDVLHALDRLSLAQAIQQHRHDVLDCFVQVNVSGEATKHGVSVTELESFIQDLQMYSKIRVIGLMTMAPAAATSEVIHEVFSTLRQLQQHIQSLKFESVPCEFLSMGMSQDYLIAIEEGATHIRLGSILFSE